MKEDTSQLIKTGMETIFLWIPSHCGIPGNDIVDSSQRYFKSALSWTAITYQHTTALS